MDHWDFHLWIAFWLLAQPLSDPVMEGFRQVEVASTADAIEQLYGQRAYMSHEMRPLAPTKFAGPAVTVLLKKEEHKEGGAASAGMLDAIDNAKPGSVYVMVLEDGADYAGIGGLMATAMKVRGLAGAVVDGSVRDTPQIRKLQFPVFSRGVVPSTTVNHYRFAGVNVPVTCAGVRVNPGDIIAADEDGVVVVPRAEGARGRSRKPRTWTTRSTARCPSLRSSSRSKKPWRNSGESEPVARASGLPSPSPCGRHPVSWRPALIPSPLV